MSGRPPGRLLGVPWVSLGVPAGSLSRSEASLEVAGGSLGGLMGALGFSWWVLGELWGPIWASLAALETIENHWFLLYFQLWGHISSQRHLCGQASDALIPCPSKYLVRFGPKSLVCPSHLSNLGQVTCLSKAFVRFGPSHCRPSCPRIPL